MSFFQETVRQRGLSGQEAGGSHVEERCLLACSVAPTNPALFLFSFFCCCFFFVLC